MKSLLFEKVMLINIKRRFFNYNSIPIAHSTQLQKTCKNMKLVLEKINCSTYRWGICGDFKMLGFLLGLQAGYTIRLSIKSLPL